jgi:ubiquinol-cytochrome c reductase cytochrome c subunit
MPQVSARERRRALLLLLLLAVLLLSALAALACSSDDDDDTPTQEPTTTAEATSTPSNDGGFSASEFYAEACATCHGADRSGGIGPAVTANALADSETATVLQVLTTGTMARYTTGLTGEQARALTAYLKGDSDSGSQAPAGPPPAGSIAPSELYATRCALCHGDAGEGSIEGPSLGSLLEDPDTVFGVIDLIREGEGRMPGFEGLLAEEDIDALAEHVVSEFSIDGDLTHGGTIYRNSCAACHGTLADGGAIIYNGRRNSPSLLDISAAHIASATRRGPGTMPAYGPERLTDEELASVAKYVLTLQTLSDPGGLETGNTGPVGEGAFAGLAIMLAVIAALWVERGGRG